MHRSVCPLEAASCHAHDSAQGLSGGQTDDSAAPGHCFVTTRPPPTPVYAINCSAQPSADLHQSPPRSFPAPSAAHSPAPRPHFQPQHASVAASASPNHHSSSPAYPPQASHRSSAAGCPQTTQQLQQKLIDRSNRAKQLIARQGRAAVSLDGSWLDPSIASPRLESLLLNQHRSGSPTAVLPRLNPLSRSSSTASLSVSTQQPATLQSNRSVTTPGQARLPTKQHDSVTTTKVMTSSPPRSGSSTPQRHNSTLSRMTQSSVAAPSELTSLQRSLSAIQMSPSQTASAAFPDTPAVASPVKTPRGLPAPPVPSAASRKKLLASLRRRSARRVLVERAGRCLLDLSACELQLPLASDANPQSISIISQPALATYQNQQLFFTSGSSVVFICFAGGLTTPHSAFPRTELAQTTYWDINSTTVHSMALTGATQRLTPVRPQVVIAQVFGVNGYLLQVRLNGTSGGVKVEAFANLAQMTAPPNSTQQKIVLDPSYTLGTQYSFRLTAGNGVINVYYGVGATVPAATYTMTSPSLSSSASMASIQEGRIVRLVGLKNLSLNGAVGRVCGPLDPVSSRHDVSVIAPPEAVSAHPSKVKVKPENLERVTDPTFVLPSDPLRGPAVLVRAGRYSSKEELHALMCQISLQEDTNGGSGAKEITVAMSWDSVQEIGRFYPPVGHDWFYFVHGCKKAGSSNQVAEATCGEAGGLGKGDVVIVRRSAEGCQSDPLISFEELAVAIMFYQTNKPGAVRAEREAASTA
ncbi:MAG: hypothetical protein WDW36_005077 [Sanguina aurantia]